MKNVKGRSKNYEFKCSLILLFLFRSLFVSFDVILSSFISHIARYAPSSTYKSTYERRTKINSTYFLEHPLMYTHLFCDVEILVFVDGLHELWCDFWVDCRAVFNPFRECHEDFYCVNDISLFVEFFDYG